MNQILKLAVALLAVLPTSLCWAVDYLGDFPTSATVNYQFTTNGSTGAPIAPLSAFESADILIYKNNSATQRTSAAGITMTSPFDSLVGLHQLSISLSDNTDAGFWAAGSDYTVVLNPDSETVDGVSVAPTVLAQFSISNRRIITAVEIRDALGYASPSHDTTTGTLTTAVNAIKTKTDFLPSATAGATGGVLIAGSNGATTFSTLTSTGAFTINGTSMVAQTGDAFTRLGVPTTTTISADIAVVASTASSTLTQATNAASSSSAVQGKLPSGGANMAAAGEGAGTPVDADVVDDSRTWFATDYRARNIVTVGDNFVGTFALAPDLNPGSTIASVSSVSITGAATVTATDLQTNRAKTRAHFTVPALTTTGTYTVVVTVTTVDGQTIPTTATLKVQ